jgi:hypothetical protein
MSGAGELSLAIERSLLGDLIEVVAGQRAEFGEELIVLASVARRVAGLE